MNPRQDAAWLARNAVDSLPEGELERKLAGGRPLRVKFGIDPTATRCALASDPLSTASSTAAGLRSEGVLASGWDPRGPTTRREVLRWLASPATRWTPS